MVKVTGRPLKMGNKEIEADAFGNNVAFKCPKCGYPVLAVVRKGQRGSQADNPSNCKGCKADYLVTPNNWQDPTKLILKQL